MNKIYIMIYIYCVNLNKDVIEIKFKNLKIEKINYELSQEMFNKYKDLIKPKECYLNIANILMLRISELNSIISDLKIVFGVTQVMIDDCKNYVKHCYFKYNNHIIDPTFFAIERNKSDETRNYISVKELSVKEYLYLLTKYNGDTSLVEYMNNDFEKISKELSKVAVTVFG